MMVKDVPLYKQSYGYSCGPASMLMVMGSIDKSIRLDNELENSIWEDANLVESKATSAFGLALASRKRGFFVTVWADSDGIGFTKRLKKHFRSINVDRLNELHEITRRKAIDLGVKERPGKVTLKVLSSRLDNGIHPIVLISTRLMGEWIAIPHWVVVTNISKDTVTIQNPETASVENYHKNRFMRHLGFSGNARMICVQGPQ